MTTSRLRALLLVLATLALGVSLAACGGDDGDGDSASTPTTAAAITRNTDNADVKLTIGSKNFTEQKVLGEIYAQALAAAGYDVSTELNLGDEKTARKALEDGQISAYPEYTGTALLSFFDVPADELPTDPAEAYDQVSAGFQKEGITAFPPTPFTSSNEVAVTKATAEKLDLETISDLRGQEGDLALYGSPECRQRRDCLLGLQEVYDLDFGSFTPVDIAQRHEVLKSGDADVSIVFTTDPQNKRDGFVLLRDDKGMFPPYNSTFLVKDSTVQEAGPDLEATVEMVNENLTAEVMQELNARVDLDKETPKQAAAGYLQQYGLVTGS
jgi:osmoprotectant transport system substrate-binding protein